MIAAAMLCPGGVLICWVHENIPRIVREIPTNLATPVPAVWPDDGQGNGRFDLVWAFEYDRAASTYRFSQVPQMLLAGDLSEESYVESAAPASERLPQRLLGRCNIVCRRYSGNDTSGPAPIGRYRPTAARCCSGERTVACRDYNERRPHTPRSAIAFAARQSLAFIGSSAPELEGPTADRLLNNRGEGFSTADLPLPDRLVRLS